MNIKSPKIVKQIRKDLYKLANFLEDKAPLDDRLNKDARSWLLETEHIMRGAIEKIEDSQITRSLNKAHKLLPNADSDPKEWPQQLRKAANIL